MKKTTRTKVLPVRISPQEHAIIVLAAAEQRKKVATYIRDTVLRSARRVVK